MLKFRLPIGLFAERQIQRKIMRGLKAHKLPMTTKPVQITIIKFRLFKMLD